MADVGFQNGFIRLEQIPAVYYAGQTLNGSVVFDLRRPLNFTALYIQYHGEANVLWSYMEYESINGMKRSREVKYQGHEEYFNYTETLAGGNGTSQLPPTKNTFSFKYQIPFICPSTFRGQKGSISYSITATMVYPDMRREELKTEFTVVAPLDLNTGNPALKDPIDLELEELNPCNWCYGSNAVTVRLRLPVTGYCPGQTIPVAVEVDNDSNVEITKMVFEITTKELYRSHQPPSEYVLPGTTLTTVNKGAVMSGSKKNFTCEVIVPDMVVPYLENCGIIDIGYFFKATVVMSGCNDDIQEEAEICLGLVPLRETLTAEYIHPKADSLPSGPIPTPPLHGSRNSINRSQNNLNQNLSPAPFPPYHGSYNSLNRSQNNLNHNLSPGSLAPYPGSHNSLNRSQNNLNYSNSNLNNPPPYPGGNAPYPGGNAPYPGGNAPYPGGNAPYPSENKNPNSHDIGFRVHPPYPAASVLPGASPPPYPTGNSPQRGSVPPYPTGNSPQGGSFPPYPSGNSSQGAAFPPYPANRAQGNNPSLPPNGQGGYAPSAPPAAD